MKRSISTLTSLRFFAAALIVVDHVGGPLSPWIRERPTYQGVTFFFVLSGFILTYSYPHLDKWSDVKLFWVARIARIWPAAFASMILAFLIVPGIVGEYWSPEGVLRVLLTVFCLQAWIPVSYYYFAVSAVLWSISCEVFFYVMFPWLARDIRTTWPWKFAMCASTVVALIVLATYLGLPTYAHSASQVDAGALIYSLPLCRLFDFMIGIVAAMLFGRYFQGSAQRWTVATLVELSVTVLVILQFQWGPYWYEWGGPFAKLLPRAGCLWVERSGNAFLYGALIIVFAREGGVLSRMLGANWLVLGGEISYSIYLLHQIYLRYIKARPQLFEHIPPIPLYVGYTILLLLTSWCMWRFVETPCRKLIVRRYHAATEAGVAGSPLVSTLRT